MSQQPPFNHISACVFDAYGTLFDVHSAVAKHYARIGDQAEQLSQIWRSKQLEYTWLRTLMGAYCDFWQVTGDALYFALNVVQIDDHGLHDDLMQAYLSLDTYPEVRSVLEALKASNRGTAILSNGSPMMLAAAVDNADIAPLLDVCLSVDCVGAFKPSPQAYQLALDKLELSSANILFMSSNGWDVAGASQFGMNTVWVNRFLHTAERLPSPPALELSDLSGLLDILAE